MNVAHLIRPALVGLTFAQLVLVPFRGHSQPAAARPWNDAIEARLELAGTNRSELAKAFREAPADRREGLSFLVENMPESDLKTLSAAFLLDNLDLAYQGWEKSPWQSNVTREMFFNDVLPYACLNEERDPVAGEVAGGLFAHGRFLQNPG